MSLICWLTQRRLGAYRDGELGPAARTKTAAHLTGCPRCAGELDGLTRLRAALTIEAPELPEGVWQAFWPQVRARMAASPPPEPHWRPVWDRVVGHRRLALGSAVAAAALAVLAVFAPWQRVGERFRAPVVHSPSAVTSGPPAGASIQQVVIQSVETADPQSSVMVFTSPESDVTVVWVFGLEPTEI